MAPGNENIRVQDELCNRPFAMMDFPHSDDPTEGCHKTACQMVVAHNMFIRFLNSIYLQAEGVEKDGTKEDVQSFLWYVNLWCTRMHHHHNFEETSFFPKIRDRANNQTILTDAVDQHDGFKPELKAFGDYIEQALNGEAEYSGAKVKHLIDQFGNNLREHFENEIMDLEALKSHISGKEVWSITEQCSNEEMKMLKATEDAPMAVAMLRAGPGNEQYAVKIPAVAKYLAIYVFWWHHADSWRFLPCDHFAAPKTQLAFYKP